MTLRMKLLAIEAARDENLEYPLSADSGKSVAFSKMI